jgi:hypothetical protein
MNWPLRNCRVVGSMCALVSSSPFGRDAVVLAHDEQANTRLIVGQVLGDGTAVGEQLSADDWRALCESGEVLALTSPVDVADASRPWSWLLRANFPQRAQAAAQLRERAGAVLREEPRNDVLIFIVDEAHARPVLDAWSRAAFDDAWRLAQSGDWARAHEHADLAWLTDVGLELDRVALLALAIEYTEGQSAAEDFITFELASRKRRPEQELRQRIAGYRLQFETSPPRSGLRARMHELQNGHRIAPLAAWQRDRDANDCIFPGAGGGAHPSASRAS